MILGALIARLLAIIGFAGFCAALAVHISALRGIDVVAHIPAATGLHIVALAVFGAAIFVSAGRKAQSSGWGRTFALLDSFPAWFRLLLGAFFLYAIVNFVLCLAIMPNGSPTIADGQFALNNHGTTRFVSQTEYLEAKVAQIRMFSGHWMLFLLAGSGILWFRSPPHKA